MYLPAQLGAAALCSVGVVFLCDVGWTTIRAALQRLHPAAGEKGMGKSGKALTYEGSIFHRQVEAPVGVKALGLVGVLGRGNCSCVWQAAAC